MLFYSGRTGVFIAGGSGQTALGDGTGGRVRIEAFLPFLTITPTFLYNLLSSIFPKIVENPRILPRFVVPGPSYPRGALIPCPRPLLALFTISRLEFFTLLKYIIILGTVN